MPSSRATRARRYCALMLVVAGLACLPACGDGGTDAGAQGRERTVTEVIREAVEKAKGAAKERSGGTSPRPSTRSTIGTDGQAAFDYEDYQGTLSATIGRTRSSARSGTSSPGTRAA